MHILKTALLSAYFANVVLSLVLWQVCQWSDKTNEKFWFARSNFNLGRTWDAHNTSACVACRKYYHERRCVPKCPGQTLLVSFLVAEFHYELIDKYRFR